MLDCLRNSIADHYLTPRTRYFKCKSKSDWTIRKFKSQYFIIRDIQKRMYPKPLNSYYPVLQWSTVRLMLILQCIIFLKSQSTDFTNDFAQADIPSGEPFFIELPSYFKSDRDKGYVVLRLKKGLYGQAKTARLWDEKLRNGLLERGFVMSKVDPFLLMSKNMIFVVYVDDCLFWASSQSDIDNVMKSFKEDGPSYIWKHSKGQSVSEILGIDIKILDDGGFQFFKLD